jgi:hypothetical protein
MSSSVGTNFFGTSLALQAGDLVFQKGDLALISGLENFAQAVGVIVATPFGSDQVNVNYGLDVASIFTLANTVSSIKNVIRLNLAKSLAIDDRLREINEVLFDDEAGFAQLAPEFASADPGAAARHGRVWHAVIALTTVTGNQQQLIVSGASP